ncbi:MAG TPA: hypothetical protein VIM51_12225 [Desulfosporosinus sp.]
MGGNELILSQWKNRIFWQNMAGASTPNDLTMNIVTGLRLNGYTGTL